MKITVTCLKKQHASKWLGETVSQLKKTQQQYKI